MPFIGDNSPTTTPKPPAPGPLAPAVTPPPPPVNPYDFSSDPLYQQILALGDQRTAQARAAALRAQTQSLIDYGDPDLVRSLGLGDDVAAAAAENPFSIFAQLKKAEHDRPLALDEALNKQNLFYSGHRGLAQSDLAQSLLQARYNASQTEQGALTGINSSLLGSLNAIQDQETAAAQAAAARKQAELGDLPQAVPNVSVAGAKPITAASPPAVRTVSSQLVQAARPRGLPRGSRIRY